MWNKIRNSMLFQTFIVPIIFILILPLYFYEQTARSHGHGKALFNLLIFLAILSLGVFAAYIFYIGFIEWWGTWQISFTK
jgi:hypothetical protein